jgi:hypothetical protein
MNSTMRNTACGLVLAMVVGMAISEAHAGYRQYYSSWSYYPSNSYYYSTYYYKPQPSYNSYNYHYCVYYPTQPRYVYYYNPYSQQYWGRYDLEAKGEACYSLLKEEDRKKELKDIPESAFPAPAKLPAVPESTDGAQIEAPRAVPEKDLPAGNAPKP